MSKKIISEQERQDASLALQQVAVDLLGPIHRYCPHRILVRKLTDALQARLINNRLEFKLGDRGCVCEYLNAHKYILSKDSISSSKEGWENPNLVLWRVSSKGMPVPSTYRVLCELVK